MSLMVYAMFILSMTVTFVTSDLAWSLNDELSAPETEFSLNDEVFTFDQDGSDLFSQDGGNSGLNSKDNDNVDDPFELAGCTSELFPAFGKSRMRRRRESADCKNPAFTPSMGAFPVGPPIDPFGIFQNQVDLDSMRNSDCKLLTLGLLEIGLCHSGVGALPAGIDVTIGGLIFKAFDLQHCSPALPSSTVCPSPQRLYCCVNAYGNVDDPTNIRGEICVPISAIVGDPQF